MPDLPGVGKVSKRWVLIVAVGSVGAIGYVLWRRHQASAAAASSSATTAPASTSGDPYPPDGSTGNPSDPNSTDPETGMTYGDEQLYGGGFGGAGFGAFGFPGSTGGGIGTTGTTGTGGPPFSSNAAWASYVEGQLAGIVDAATLSAAIGVYLTGRPASSDQESLIDQAIAIGGYPPVAGSPGNPQAPPAIVHGGGPGPGGKVTVPNVVGMETAAGDRALTAAGLAFHHPPLKAGVGSTITATAPKAGASVPKGTTVQVSIKEK